MGDTMDFLYHWSTLGIALIVVLTAIACASVIFVFARRLLMRLEYFKSPEAGSINEAITGAVGAIGVLFGITVGLIAIDVWQRHSSAKDVAAREAALIQTLYLAADSLKGGGVVAVSDKSEMAEQKRPDAARAMRQGMQEYLKALVCITWRYQRAGVDEDWPQQDFYALRKVRHQAAEFDPEPKSEGARIRYAETIRLLDQLIELRGVRADAADDRMSGSMWAIIVLGSLMTLFAVCLFKLDDVKLHFALVASLSGLVGLLILIIVINDRPFRGISGIEPDAYMHIGWIIEEGPNDFKESDWDWVSVCENKYGLKPGFIK
jgi:hypothetical protein